jgi:hypothetical protein
MLMVGRMGMSVCVCVYLVLLLIVSGVELFMKLLTNCLSLIGME